MVVKNLKIIQWAISRKSNAINFMGLGSSETTREATRIATVDDIVRTIEKFIVKLAHSC